MPIQKTDRDTQWNITQNNKTWTLAESAKITVTGQNGISESGYDGSNVRVLGDITVKSAGYSGIFFTGEDASILIGSNARINAKQADFGIRSDGTFADIVNRGTVDGADYGIYGSGDDTLRNFGNISGDTGVAFGGSESRIVNHGQVRGLQDGITMESEGYLRNEKGGMIVSEQAAIEFNGSGLSEVVNRGLIRSDDVAIHSAGSVHIKNSGRIVGDIEMGGLADTLDTRKGVIKGDVFGGDGNDLYFVGKSSVTIIEEAGGSGGHDRVSSTSGHLLETNIEDLFLLGRKDIDGAGNASDNLIAGNKGDNNLFGLDGNDFISGGGGNDVLYGGDGADAFIFVHLFGIDRIADFTDGSDKLDIEGVLSQQHFDELDIIEKNGNLIIDMDFGNKVIIEDMLLSQLSYAQDFAPPT